MANKTLISAVEVVEKGHFEHNYDSKLLCSHIVIAEEKFLRAPDASFGQKLYHVLLNDVINFQEFDIGYSYSIGDSVIYAGKYYRCIQPSINILPDNISYWGNVGKFSTSIYQTLWDDYLWHYLALGVQHTATFKSAYRSSSKGIVRLEADFVKAAEYSGIKALKEELLDNMAVLKSAMHRFLIANEHYFPEYHSSICSSEILSRSGARIGLFIREKS